ncbi:MAG: dinitrogenase iron-molybdenum cofactor biosynthesis protein, partial [Clostridia bacterium]|nr:dinitrogenase iron-molybdenum cofactor biosynthesis protein [Clostridia bacterium]
MKIAVTYDNGQIFQHFGHTEQFKIYDVKNDKIISKTVISTNGQGHGALSSFLKENNVDVLICGGIGGGAISALNELGIKLFGGVSGDCDSAVEAFLKNELEFNPNV